MNVNKVPMQASWGQMAAEDSPRTGAAGSGRGRRRRGGGSWGELARAVAPEGVAAAAFGLRGRLDDGGCQKRPCCGGHAVAAMLDAGREPNLSNEICRFLYVQGGPKKV